MGNGNSRIHVDNQTIIDLNNYTCSNRGLLLPFVSEYTWPIWIRVVLYFVGLIYFFVGIAIICDIFMNAIEKITSKTRTIKYPDPKDPSKYIDKEVKVWNDTVANLTLMALGSSSPEILLSIIEIVGNNFKSGDLGPGTIVGSAAFNLLMITSICVSAIDSPSVRRIKYFKVFLCTSAWSFFAYFWMYFTLEITSPNVVELWEAVVTFLCFPALIYSSYYIEKNFSYSKSGDSRDEDGDDDDDVEEEKSSLLNIALQPRRIMIEGTNESNKVNGNVDMLQSRLSLDEPYLSPGLQKSLQRSNSSNDEETSINKRRIDKSIASIEFASTNYAVLENEKRVSIQVQRYGNTMSEERFRVETFDGTAQTGVNYKAINETKIFYSNQTKIEFDIQIIDNNQAQPDQIFFVKLSPLSDRVRVGQKAICMVTIIDDDKPGEIEFSMPGHIVNETEGVFNINVVRKNGADGDVSVHFKTSNISAIEGRDYKSSEGMLEFRHGEITKFISIHIIGDHYAQDKNECFEVELYEPSGGASLGARNKTVVTIINKEDLQGIKDRLNNLISGSIDDLELKKIGWREQFVEAFTVSGEDDTEPNFLSYFSHLFTFPWKVIFAFVPPTELLGGWLCFFVSLTCIGILTAVVGDLAGIFGCLVGLKDTVTAITFVALGTSLPDTFASKIAAQNEKTADNAIGNVTGSNSVNVFLGLGLPWVISALYWQFKGQPFVVESGSLAFSVLVFTIVGLTCLALLFARRFLGIFGKGELGGPLVSKYFTSAFLVILWILYITLSALQAYGHI